MSAQCRSAQALCWCWVACQKLARRSRAPFHTHLYDQKKMSGLLAGRLTADASALANRSQKDSKSAGFEIGLLPGHSHGRGRELCVSSDDARNSAWNGATKPAIQCPWIWALRSHLARNNCHMRKPMGVGIVLGPCHGRNHALRVRVKGARGG